MLCPQKLPLRTHIILSTGRYIDVSQTIYSTHLQMKTTCYMREVSIKLANSFKNIATWPFSHQKMCKQYRAFKEQNNEC